MAHTIVVVLRPSAQVLAQTSNQSCSPSHFNSNSSSTPTLPTKTHSHRRRNSLILDLQAVVVVHRRQTIKPSLEPPTRPHRRSLPTTYRLRPPLAIRARRNETKPEAPPRQRCSRASTYTPVNVILLPLSIESKKGNETARETTTTTTTTTTIHKQSHGRPTCPGTRTSPRASTTASATCSAPSSTARPTATPRTTRTSAASCASTTPRRAQASPSGCRPTQRRPSPSPRSSPPSPTAATAPQPPAEQDSQPRQEACRRCGTRTAAPRRPVLPGVQASTAGTRSPSGMPSRLIRLARRGGRCRARGRAATSLLVRVGRLVGACRTG